jgi:hypothetical protein
VLLLGLVIVADRIGASVAEGRIASTAADELKKAGATTDGKPSVIISGFPFLTQVLAGSYQKITINANKPRSGDIKLDSMTLVATDVKAAASDLLNGRGPVTAGRLTGTASMSWESVKPLIELSGVPVPFDLSKIAITGSADQVEIRVPVTIANFSTTLWAKGQVTIADGKVKLQLIDVGTDGGDLPPAAKALLNQYRSRLNATIRTPQMPYRLVLDKVTSDQSGVQVVATATGVKLVG